jgi:hypothetical protein
MRRGTAQQQPLITLPHDASALRLSSGPRLQSSSNLETPTDAGRHRTRLRTSEMAQAP